MKHACTVLQAKLCPIRSGTLNQLNNFLNYIIGILQLMVCINTVDKIPEFLNLNRTQSLLHQSVT